VIERPYPEKARLDRDLSQGPSSTSCAFITNKARDPCYVTWSRSVYTCTQCSAERALDEEAPSRNSMTRTHTISFRESRSLRQWSGRPMGSAAAPRCPNAYCARQDRRARCEAVCATSWDVETSSTRTDPRTESVCTPSESVRIAGSFDRTTGPTLDPPCKPVLWVCEAARNTMLS
jgi:hypothetical protein